jgi:Flp pilus assembly protein TadB
MAEEKNTSEPKKESAVDLSAQSQKSSHTPQENEVDEKRTKRTGGVESLLQRYGLFFAVMSIIIFVLLIIFSLRVIAQKAVLAALFIGIGVAALIQGLMLKTLFDAGAEVIRLLKRLNGLPYAGSISETEGEGKTFFCTDCGEPVAIEQKFCTQCGAKL